MTTSNSSVFNVEVWELIDEAFERIGQQTGSLTSYDSQSARRSVNLILQMWINKGVNLWTVELYQLPLTAGTYQYDLDTDTSDILEDGYVTQTVGNSTIDVVCERIMRDQYDAMPLKTQIAGRPIKFLLERNRDNPTITFWPVPDAVSTYIFNYRRIRYLQDVDTSSETLDIPRRFLPALVSALADALAQKTKYAVDPGTRQELATRAQQEFQLAFNEDRDRAPVYIRPDFRYRVR